jgi:exodeoxyribonuclease VII large subunit
MSSIRKTLEARYTSAYWIKAEMNKLNHYVYSGHCYPDLVEKTEGKVVAQMRAIIWKADFQAINHKFQQVLKEPLREGSHILFLAHIQFDAQHGLSLRILDIDPTYSLGELEREKQETTERLEREGIFHQNKTLPLPLLPQRIAVISVETSKGYADFCKIIDHNEDGFRFFHHLFPAQLQGDKAVTTIIGQLNNIRKCGDLFDVVVIVRGGGGAVGLAAFNNYLLAREIALFPIPVLTGIGHATNETVAEMVAFKNAITPTEIAHILIQRFIEFSRSIQQMESRIAHLTGQKLRDAKVQLNQMETYLKASVANEMEKHRETQQHAMQSLIKSAQYLLRDHKREQERGEALLGKNVQSYLNTQKKKLESMGHHLSIMDPAEVLKRGYSITRHNGKTIQNAALIPEGTEIESLLAQGSLTSKVISSIDK